MPTATRNPYDHRTPSLSYEIGISYSIFYIFDTGKED